MIDRNAPWFPLVDKCYLLFWIIRGLSLVGLVLSFVFIFTQRLKHFAWTEVGIAVILIAIVVSEVPFQSLEILKNTKTVDEIEIRIQYYKDYIKGKHWLVLIFIFSVVIAVGGAVVGFYFDAGLWLLFIPAAHLLLVTAKIITFFDHPEEPVPPYLNS